MQNLLIPTKIIKSKRKSISLIIKNNGDFIVRAPIKCKEEDILSFIQSKSNWIIRKRQEQFQHIIKPLIVTDNEKITILDEIYTIQLINSNRVKIVEDIIFIPKIDSKQKLISFLKNFAKKYLTMRVNEISKFSQLNYQKLSISSAKTCWGSCSFNNKLHFTYKLLLCPKTIVDYIIIHELCHTKVKNHSQTFWNMVKSIYPNYKQCEKWLKDNRGINELI